MQILRSKLCSKIISCYILDWILVLISMIVGYILEGIPPVEHEIIPSRSIEYPHLKNETIPSYLLLIISMLIPSLMIAITAFIKKKDWKLVHSTLLGLFVSIGYTYLITSILKISIGRLRPDFMKRCKANDLAASSGIICNPDSIGTLLQGRKSFPSGHSSTAFSGLAYLSLFIFYNTRTIDSGASRILLVILPIMGATFVGISRLNDYRHHWEDIVVGALMGIAAAYSCYRQYNQLEYESIQCDPNTIDINSVSTYHINNNDRMNDVVIDIGGNYNAQKS